MAPHALAAQLIAQAGESKGAGYASLGRSIGAGIAQFGANRREEKRFNLNRQDRLAEQAADNVRLERELQMRRARENNGILERREEMVTGNLRALMAAGAQESDPQVQELVSQLGRIQSSYQNNLAMTGAGQGVMPGQDFADLPKPPPIPDAKVVPGLTDSAAGPQGPVQVIDALERLRSAQSRLAEDLRRPPLPHRPRAWRHRLRLQDRGEMKRAFAVWACRMARHLAFIAILGAMSALSPKKHHREPGEAVG